ncbi:MAG: sigma 54-interacting transcriptional regulator [Myxococcales bacterium]|nr:sigma 54-interacting transcriptional regulator [Myxococcales bacterium]
MRTTRPGEEQKTSELGIAPEAHDTRLGLVVLTGTGVKMYPLPASGEVSIGRSSDADVHIDADSLSRRHAVLQVGARLRLKDLGSSNGTRVRDEAIGSQWVDVRLGEAIQLGSVTVLVRRATDTVQPQRRVWNHEYFVARLEEECRRGGSFAVLRVHAGARHAEAPEVLAGLLGPGDCLAMYAADEYEALVFGASPEAAAALSSRLQASVIEARVGLACFPSHGRDAERLVEAANGQLVPAAAVNASVVVASPAMKQLYDVINRIAVGTISVLVTGETGVGKELVAAAIHERSPRAKKTSLTLNCAAFTETLLESELFGHEKGAFTGATQAKPGLLESAEGGTVFLDEVGELPMSTQVKLLRVLEERAVRRVGSLKSRPIDVRFVTATNRDLEAEVAAGRFRQDLYFRIGGVTLLVPPLRARPEELEPLAKRFVTNTARQLGRRPPTISKAALALLEAYRWPGNIRELRNVMERAVLLCAGPTIEPEHLPREKLSAMWVSTPAQPVPVPPVTGLAPVPPGVDADERQRIIDALSRCGGNQTRAAKLLGVSRRTLLYRLDSMAIPRPQKKGS